MQVLQHDTEGFGFEIHNLILNLCFMCIVGREMVDVQLGGHTLQSHGFKVARIHMHDWIILVLLGVIEIILNVIEPFHRFVGKDMMTDLRYPLKGNTVPFWAVPVWPFFSRNN